MTIRYEKNPNDVVRGTLFLSETELEKYKEIQEIIKWYHQSKSPEPVKRAIEKNMEELFGKIIFDYLFPSLGLQVEQGERRKKTYYREEGGCFFYKEAQNPRFDAYCKASFMDLIFSFFITEKLDSMEAALFVEKCDESALYLINSGICHLRDSSLRFMTLKPSDYAGIFSIAPLTKVPRLIEVTEELLKYLGKEIYKLQKARNTVFSVPSEFKEEANNRYARIILEAFGIKINL